MHFTDRINLNELFLIINIIWLTILHKYITKLFYSSSRYVIKALTHYSV